MSKVLFLLTGSIACYKACGAISQLVRRGHAVRAAATDAALKFVGEATLEGLTRERVGTDLWRRGGALDHIAWARWADVVVVCPATANTINRMAAGLAEDLVGALLLAHDWTRPLLVAPAMNPAMWAHPATRAAVATLRDWGMRFVEPGAGRMACGEVGEGRLAEPDEIVAAVEEALAAEAKSVERASGKPVRVLVTSGGTAEPIDGVRVITNTSTGATGALIADELARAGHEVVLVRARMAARPSEHGGVRQVEFGTFAELEAVLRAELGGAEFDAVIHAAAVSDFAVEAIETAGRVWRPGEGKLASGDAPVLRLKRNPKLLDQLRTWSRRPGVCVVAFKLTNGAGPEEVGAAVDGVFAGGVADFVVHNDLGARGGGAVFPAEIWARGRGVTVRCASRPELARALVKVAVDAAHEPVKAEATAERAAKASLDSSLRSQ